jgi:hypothetical protein
VLEPCNAKVLRTVLRGLGASNRAWLLGAKAIKGQIGTFADTHTGVANQQKGVVAQIIAAEELLLQEFILLWRERAWKSLWEARSVLTTDQMGKFRKLLGQGQLIEDAAQSDKPVD